MSHKLKSNIMLSVGSWPDGAEISNLHIHSIGLTDFNLVNRKAQVLVVLQDPDRKFQYTVTLESSEELVFMTKLLALAFADGETVCQKLLAKAKAHRENGIQPFKKFSIVPLAGGN